MARRESPDKVFAKRFHAALRLAGLNVTQWAKRERYSAGFVYGVLDGSRTSGPCRNAMDAFIAKQFSQAA